MQQTNNENYESPINYKQRSSNSTTISQECSYVDEKLSPAECIKQFFQQFSIRNFQSPVSQSQVTTKMHRRSIGWLMTLCWGRDIEDECLSMAIMIYYLYKTKFNLKKIQLQKTLSACLLISGKITYPQKVSVKQVLQITANKFSSKEIIQTQADIISSLDYDICQKNILHQLAFSNFTNEKEKSEFYFCSQLLLIRNSQIFWQHNLSQSLIKLINDTKSEQIEQLKSQLLVLAKSNQGNFLIRKYSSKLDTQQVLAKLQKIEKC